MYIRHFVLFLTYDKPMDESSLMLRSRTGYRCQEWAYTLWVSLNILRSTTWACSIKVRDWIISLLSTLRKDENKSSSSFSFSFMYLLLDKPYLSLILWICFLSWSLVLKMSPMDTNFCSSFPHYCLVGTISISQRNL